MNSREILMALACEHLALAPFDSARWTSALECLASVTGSSHGQLAGWMPPNLLPISLFTSEPDGIIQQWLDIGGSDPLHNPIVRRGNSAAVLDVISDVEVISQDARRLHPMWGEFYDKVDLPHLCYTPIWADGDSQLVLAVPRSGRDGPIDDEQRSAFEALAYRFQSAAALVRSLRMDAVSLLKGTLEVTSIAAIILDGFQRILTMTNSAEMFLDETDLLQCRQRRLHARRDIEAQLAHATMASVRRDYPPPLPFVVEARDARGAPVSFRVTALPRDDHDLGIGAAAIIIVEKAVDLHPNLQLSLLLTEAETEIALALLKGARAAEIAADRGTTYETVRSQVKSIYAKLNVSSHVAFIARMNSWQR